MPMDSSIKSINLHTLQWPATAVGYEDHIAIDDNLDAEMQHFVPVPPTWKELVQVRYEPSIIALLCVEERNTKFYADELGVSYSKLRKLFKEHTGLSPALFQQDLKLQRAKELLSSTSHSVKEIAYRLGFDSPDYFSSKFKAKNGCKPSEFRDQGM